MKIEVFADPDTAAQAASRCIAAAKRGRFTVAIVYFVCTLPLDAATALAVRICRFAAPKTRRHRRALKNLEKAMPGNSRSARLPAGGYS